MQRNQPPRDGLLSESVAALKHDLPEAVIERHQNGLNSILSFAVLASDVSHADRAVTRAFDSDTRSTEVRLQQ